MSVSDPLIGADRNNYEMGHGAHHYRKAKTSRLAAESTYIPSAESAPPFEGTTRCTQRSAESAQFRLLHEHRPCSCTGAAPFTGAILCISSLQNMHILIVIVVIVVS